MPGARARRAAPVSIARWLNGGRSPSFGGVRVPGRGSVQLFIGSARMRHEPPCETHARRTRRSLTLAEAWRGPGSWMDPPSPHVVCGEEGGLTVPQLERDATWVELRVVLGGGDGEVGEAGAAVGGVRAAAAVVELVVAGGAAAQYEEHLDSHGRWSYSVPASISISDRHVLNHVAINHVYL